MAWTLLKIRDIGQVYMDHKEWMLDNASDISNPVDSEGNSIENTGAPGSIAATADYSSIWRKNSTGDWVEV